MLGIFLAAVYGITIVELGIIISISFFFSAFALNGDITLLVIFMVYLFITSTLFLLYVEWGILNSRRERERDAKLESHSDHGSPLQMQATELDDIYLENHQEGYTEKENRPSVSESLPMKTPHFGISRNGLNFYLKSGALCFAAGAISMDIIIMVQIFEGRQQRQCTEASFLAVLTSRIIFFVVQLAFILRHSQTVILWRQRLMKLGCVHVIVTNLVNWIMIVAREGAAIMAHTTLHSNHSHAAASLGRESKNVTMYHCMTQDTLANKLAPLLFPLQVEYCLISAAVLVRVCYNIGKTSKLLTQPLTTKSRVLKLQDVSELAKKACRCNIVNVGLVSGIFVLIGTIICTVYFLMLKEKSHGKALHQAGVLYGANDIILNILAAVVTIAAIVDIRHIHKDKMRSKSLDKYLLMISALGFYFIIWVVLLPVFYSLAQAGVDIVAIQLTLWSKLTNFAQGSLQVYLIYDSLHRTCASYDQAAKQYGRSMISFLMLTNLAMWVVNTFQFRELVLARLLRDFYGDLTTIILIHISLPLAVFFRFHSSVCFSDMWHHMYRTVIYG